MTKEGEDTMVRIREIFKHTLKSMLMCLDGLLFPFVLPYIIKKKGIKSIHLSIDDVRYDLSTQGRGNKLLLDNDLMSFFTQTKCANHLISL